MAPASPASPDAACARPADSAGARLGARCRLSAATSRRCGPSDACACPCVSGTAPPEPVGCCGCSWPIEYDANGDTTCSLCVSTAPASASFAWPAAAEIARTTSGGTTACAAINAADPTASPTPVADTAPERIMDNSSARRRLCAGLTSSGALRTSCTSKSSMLLTLATELRAASTERSAMSAPFLATSPVSGLSGSCRKQMACRKRGSTPEWGVGISVLSGSCRNSRPAKREGGIARV
eukprot:360329-Chlamydomonas_euryale.AAC.12